jgi:hypothetical protein
MLHDRGQRDVERLGQLRDGDRPFAQSLNHRPARGIAQGMEDAVDLDSLGEHRAFPVLLDQ